MKKIILQKKYAFAIQGLLLLSIIAYFKLKLVHLDPLQMYSILIGIFFMSYPTIRAACDPAEWKWGMHLRTMVTDMAIAVFVITVILSAIEYNFFFIGLSLAALLVGGLMKLILSKWFLI